MFFHRIQGVKEHRAEQLTVAMFEMDEHVGTSNDSGFSQ